MSEERRHGDERQPSSLTAGSSRLAGRFYAAVWRWHFYAGLYVIPFLIMLARLPG